MNLTEILAIILFILASVLIVALIYYFYQITKSLHSINLNLQGYSSKLFPLIQSVLEFSEKAIHITNEIESQLQISRSIVSGIRERTDKILDVETRIRNGIEDAVMPIIKNINAVGIGFGSFWRNYKRK